MKRLSTFSLILLALSGTAFSAGYLEVRAPGYNFRSAEYATSHVFIDEVAGTSADIEVLWTLTGYTNITDVEVFTNLNRRDLARVDKNGDGYPDGIVGIDGNTVSDSPGDTDPDSGHYYAPVNMTDADSNGIWELAIPATKTGAYRLTARFKTANAIPENGNDPNKWIWYGLRDHAVVVAPVDSRNVQLYVMNVFNVEASDDTFAGRSTLEDLHDASNAPHNFVGGGSKWNLDYLKGLGMNWLWFQPIHPVGIDGREPSGGYDTTTDPYDPGSPYAVKNFFEVNELMSVNYDGNASLATNRATAMAAFQEFATAADEKGVGIMLDAPFNHTAFDVELAEIGVQLFQRDGEPAWSPYDEIRNRDARFFSLNGNYGNRASSGANIAPGPDRFDFGKWRDVKDVFFGRYDALVEIDDGGAERSSYTSEGDWFDSSDADWTTLDFTQGGQQWNVTRRVWDYFAEYAVHWLEKTRPAGHNRNSAPSDGDPVTRYTWDARGIDGLRCDFGQGLPPQAWEYIINVARSHKWNFVMMSESLDGGAVTYRSSRHFEILNENIVFPLKSAGNAQDYRNIFEGRRSAYGQALVLTNTTSHDEENYSDPWQVMVRNAVTGSMDGATLIFPGQELGIATDNKGNEDASDNYNFGYDHYETNFGKTIPHFKRWNSMMPAWNDSDFGNDQLYPVHSGIQTARNNSPALRSPNRWFLNGNGFNGQIFAAAKYQAANASPATSDVVLAFANLDRNNDQSDNFKLPVDLTPLLGLKDGRSYNVKNIAAYTAQTPNRRDVWLWSSNYTKSQLENNGFYVDLKKVPTTQAAWATVPYEAQYLKVYDVTELPAPASSPVAASYALDGSVTFTWPAVVDPEGLIPRYRLTVTRSDGQVTDYETTGTTYTITGLPTGVTATATVITLNPNNTSVASSPTSSSPQTISIASADDSDGDGMSNGEEDIAGTNPLDAASLFKVNTVASESSGGLTVTWDPVPGKTYSIERSTTLAPDSWTAVDTNNTTGSYTDPSPPTGKAFYRVKVAR